MYIVYTAIQTYFEMADDYKEGGHDSESHNTPPFYTILYHSHFELWKNKPAPQHRNGLNIELKSLFYVTHLLKLCEFFV